MIFRVHDFDENGIISRMDLFQEPLFYSFYCVVVVCVRFILALQGLNTNNYDERHYPPDIIKAIGIVFEKLDETGMHRSDADPTPIRHRSDTDPT